VSTIENVTFCVIIKSLTYEQVSYESVDVATNVVIAQERDKSKDERP
jgi:hypothetical protein